MSYLRVEWNVETEVGCWYGEGSMIIKDNDPMWVNLHRSDVSLHAQRDKWKGDQKSIKKRLNKTNTWRKTARAPTPSPNYSLNCSMYIFADFFLHK